MATNVGSIEYDARINTSMFKRDASEVQGIAKATATGIESMGGRIQNFGDSFTSAGNKISSFGSNINRVALPASIALGAGFGLVGKMAFDQVNAVEQATLALRAYEGDGTKVNNVLKGLLSYARSDLGVLFNRKDLFAAAQGLKVMGDNTDQLTDHVKIMSRAVGLGLTTWDNLSEIVGRVGSTGRLTGIDFDNLTKAGYRLDPALRNTNITFDQLFKAMDKGIPINALEGQADSIKGIGVRVQTAFRGIGESILGVDKDTGQFIKGGAGAQLTQFFKDLPKLLSDPKIQQSFKQIGQSLADFVQNALPKIVSFITFIGEHIDVISKLTFGLLAFGIAMKVVGSVMTAVGTAIQLFGFIIKGLAIAIRIVSLAFTFLAANPIVLIIAAIVALIAGLVYLQLKFNILGKALDFVKSIIGSVVGFIMNILGVLKNAIVAYFTAYFTIISTVFNALKSFISGVWNTIYSIISGIVSRLIGFFAGAFNWLLGAGKNIVKGLASGISSMAGSIWGAISSVASGIGRFFSGAGSWLFNAGKAIIQGLISGIKSMAGAIVNAVKSVLGKLAKFFPFSPAKEGPFSGKGWTLYSGQKLIQGFAEGILGQKSTLSAAMNDTLGTLDGNLNAPALRTINSIEGTATSNPNPVVITVNMDGIMARSRSDLRDIAKDLVGSIDEELRAKGLNQIMPRTT